MFRKRHSVRLLAVVGAAALLAGCPNGGEEQGPVTITVSEIGYLEVLPPSRLHFPGTINSVTVKNDGQVLLDPTCEFDETEILQAVQRSPVPEKEWSRVKEESVGIAGVFKGIFSVEAGIQGMEGSSISITNPEILVLSDAKLREIRINTLKNGHCEAAIKDLVNRNIKVCQIRAALKGDMVHSSATKEKDELSTEVQDEIILQNSTELDSSDEMAEASITYGEQMFFAVRLYPDGLFFRQTSVKDEDYNIPDCPQL